MIKKIVKVMNAMAMTALLTVLVGGSAYVGVKAYPEIEAAKTAKTYVETVNRNVERHEVEDVVDNSWRDAIRFQHMADEVKAMGNKKEDYTLTVLNGVTTVTAVRFSGYHMSGRYYVETHTYSVNDKDMTIVHTCDTRLA